jgi:hypothetical protein
VNKTTRYHNKKFLKREFHWKLMVVLLQGRRYVIWSKNLLTMETKQLLWKDFFLPFKLVGNLFQLLPIWYQV